MDYRLGLLWKKFLDHLIVQRPVDFHRGLVTRGLCDRMYPFGG